MELKNFDAKKETENIVAWIKNWFEENGPTANAVVGVSGGKDSSVVTTLLVRALGKERVEAVLMPKGIQPDIEDSKSLVRLLGLEGRVVNIKESVEAVEKSLLDSGLETLSEDTRINIQPRIRMTVLYAVAQSLKNGGRVANTCNRSEDWIGYSTKYGDAAGDFSPLANYTVSEVLKIGEYLGLPDTIVHKTPSDGLSGRSDEDKIGFTYDTLDNYILNGICEDEKTKEKIDRMHRLNLHKLKTIPTCPKSQN